VHGSRLLAAGLGLVTLHLLDLALSGSDTTALGVEVIVALPLAAWLLWPRVGRVTRGALAGALGVVFAVAGALNSVYGVFAFEPRWSDTTGIAGAIGGVLLIVAGGHALAAPGHARAASRARRAAHGLGWMAGAFVVGELVLVPLVTAVVVTHPVRSPVSGSELAAAHTTVHIPLSGGRLAGWFVPSRNGAAVLLVHGSGDDRAGVAPHAELLARAGYGVLAIDLPGHGASDGRANLLGGNAQPAIAAALDWLSAQPGVRPDRLSGLGLSLGAEVLLEAAARDARLRAVVADGAERASDDRRLYPESGLAGAVGAVTRFAVRAVTGTREPPPLLGLLPRLAPRPVLLIAAGGRPREIPVNRAYRRAAGSTARLWTVPEAAHTGALAARPAEYARRVVTFLDAAVCGSAVRGLEQPG
jgi:pimeloyl-ACP methyl ester carboxylesterase